ncbi:hypothetical protein VTL71DRAFT_2744 [Oculimacula yallundae]|uniref:Myb-like DNA-binding domain-containing protein n=1 Tax=Oculimacula yallundae TaxID=86028 RepID=A0ABR4CAH7_9HELO
MQNDNPITRLLYAILSQKCLKDINWDKVANDPLLVEDKKINGHAARMRYSRFKKQMDAASGNLPPPTPRKPRKSRVEKTKSPKKEKRPGDGVKSEYERERKVKSEFADRGREGTGESSLSPNLSGFGERRTPDLGTMHSSAVSLAGQELASGLGLNLGNGHNLNHRSPLHFEDAAVQIKRERKPSANTLLSTGQYLQTQNSPVGGPFPPEFHPGSQGQQHITSSVSNSTLPSTPRLCIEEQEYSPTHSPSQSQGYPYQHPSHHSHVRPHPAYRQEYDPRAEESFNMDPEDMEDMDIDEMMHSFGMPTSKSLSQSGHELYSPLLNDSAFAFGMDSPGLGMGIGMDGGSYEEFWGHGHGEGGTGNGEREKERVVGGVNVKKEERWEEGYRRV